MISAGTAKFGNEEVQLDTNALVDQIHELDDVPIKSNNDQQVLLKDIEKLERKLHAMLDELEKE